MNERALITLGLLAACTTPGGPGKGLTRLHEKMRQYQAREPANAIVLTVLGAAAAFYVAERGRNAKVTSFYDALRAAGVDATLRILPGIGHGWDPGLTRGDVVSFFERTLGVIGNAQRG